MIGPITFNKGNIAGDKKENQTKPETVFELSIDLDEPLGN